MTQSGSYILRCRSCGTRNKIPETRIGETAQCGKCRENMDTGILRFDSPLIITDSIFQEEVVRSPLPVLLDCWAPWCGPCRMMGPFMEELAREWQGRVRVAKLNVDENPRTASLYQIQSIPTLLIFENRQLRNTLTGALPKHSVKQAMSPWL